MFGVCKIRCVKRVVWNSCILPESNMALENWCLGDYSLFRARPMFTVDVSFGESHSKRSNFEKMHDDTVKVGESRRSQSHSTNGTWTEVTSPLFLAMKVALLNMHHCCRFGYNPVRIPCEPRGITAMIILRNCHDAVHSPPGLLSEMLDAKHACVFGQEYSSSQVSSEQLISKFH